MDKSLRVQVLMAAVDRVTGPLRNVLKGSKATAAGLKETAQELKALNAAQKDVARFRELKAGLSSTSGELDQARARAAALAAQVAATASPTRKLNREFDQARQVVNRLEAAHQAQARELQEVRGRMDAAGRAGKSLAQHERELRDAIGRTNAQLEERKAKLAAVAQHQARVEKAKAGFDRSQEMAGNLAGAGAGSAGMGAAILAPLAVANKTAADYESTLTTVAQKANLSREAAKALGVELTGVGKAANQLPADVVAATDALTGLGAELDQARAMIPGIARASTAYQASMEDMGRATWSAVDTLKVPVKETAKVLDIMATAGNAGSFEIANMAQHFPSLTAAAAGLGQTGVGAVADLAAALQIVAKGAGGPDEAATNLSNLMQKISAPLTTKNFKKFGIDLEKELKAAAKRGESPIETIAALTQKATGGDLSKLGYLFEDAQVQKALRPLIQNTAKYQEIRREALAAEGTVGKDYAERIRDQNEAMKAAKIAAQDLGLQIGSALAPTVTALAGMVTNAANAVAGWAKRNPELAATVAKVAAVVGVVLAVIGGLALAVAAVLGPLALANLAFVQAGPALAILSKGLGFARLAVMALGRAFLLNPIGLAVTAIAVAAFLIIRHWSQISAFFRDLWARVQAATAGALTWFQGLGARFRQFGADLISGLIGGITGRLAALKSTVVGVASSAASWFKERLGIHSPSRVFAGFGGDTMAGLAQGLQRGQREPLDVVKATAAGLARTMAQTAARSPAGLVAGGLAAAAMGGPAAAAGPAAPAASYEIHVHAAPGMSPEDLARLVVQKIQEHERAKGARGRSTLGDTSEN